MDTYAFLQHYDIRPSVQRYAVMSYLLAHHTHPTAEEIYSALSGQMPTLSKTTVYNTLHLLVSKGAVHMVTIDEHNVVYDATIRPHGHFLCTRCGKLKDVPIDEDILASIPQIPSGYRVDTTSIYYKGLCPRCLGKEEKTAQLSSPPRE